MAIKRKTINLTVNGNALAPVYAATGQPTTDAGVQGENEAVWLHADVPADWQDLTVKLRVTALDGTYDESDAAVNNAVDMPLRQGVLVPGRLALALVGLAPDGSTGNYLVRKSADCRTLTVQASAQPTDPAAEQYPQAFESIKDEVQGECIHTVVGAGAAQVTRLDGQTVRVGFTGGGGGDMLAANYANGSGAANTNMVDHAQAADSVTPGGLLQGGWMWLPACTFASATSFTIAQDFYSVITPGDKIRLVQSGATKYFYVAGVSVVGNTTTVNVAGGSDYTLANAAITSPCLSHAASPDRFPDWLNWAPTLGASGSMTVSAVTVEQAKFKMNSREVVISMHASFTLGGTASNTVTVTLPINSSYAYACVSASVFDTTAFGGGVAILPASASSTLSVRKPDASVFTIGSAKQVFLGGSYPI